MKGIWKSSALALSLAVASSLVQAQTPNGKDQPKLLAASSTAEVTVRPTGTAAKVNNQTIPEAAVVRALKAVPTEERSKARTEIVQFLVDNVLIDQYLTAIKIAVEPIEIEKQMVDFQNEVKKHNQEYAKVLDNLILTEAELREQIVGQIRWEKFVAQQATPDTLQKMFQANMDVFDGSMVRARHILVTPTAETDRAKQDSLAKMQQIKAALDKAVENAMATQKTAATPEEKEKLKARFTEDAFVSLAKDHSNCPSSRDGGDLNFFPRAGSMVEPFAKAAFALKVGQLSEIVQTQFGYHLILVTGRKAGTPTDFDKVKDAVKEYYEGKLREAVTRQMREKSKIEILDGK